MGRAGLEKVLITSAAGKVPLVRAMQAAVGRINPEARVIAGDLDALAPARHVADDFWQMPRLEAVTRTALIEACQERGIRMILPTRDGELGFWADARCQFAAAGIDVIVSCSTAVERCTDKLAFAQWGAVEGLPVIAASLDPAALGSSALVVKERYGAGARGIGLNLTHKTAQVFAKGLSAPIYQPMIEGPEISVDAYMTLSGDVHGLVLRRRDRVAGGESQVTTTFRDAKLEAQAAIVLNALAMSGPVVMQAIVTETGIEVIEVNARFGGASTASLPVGLDMLYWALLERQQPESPLPEFVRLDRDVRQVRVPQDMLIDDPDF